MGIGADALGPVSLSPRQGSPGSLFKPMPWLKMLVSPKEPKGWDPDGNRETFSRKSQEPSEQDRSRRDGDSDSR